jgi:pseudouridine kinase
MNSRKALVIGGMNIDILGTPTAAFHPGDSLPGRVGLSVGGVGYNIAARLAGFGMRVTLFTAIGEDFFACIAEKACEEKGIDISLSLRVPAPSPIYMAIHGQDGAMTAAINDMAAIAKLAPDHLEAHRHALSGPFDVCVIDANLPEETLSAIPRLVKAPILADPVSCEKGRRLLPVLSYLTAIKPNAMEALALSGREDIPAAARFFVAQGVKQVYVSMGKDGLYCADAKEEVQLPSLISTTAPSTGAGDALAAGLALGIAAGKSTADTARMGLEAAADYLKTIALER